MDLREHWEDTESELSESSAESEDEHHFLQKRLAFHESQGRARPRRSDCSQRQVQREFEEFEKFCQQAKYGQPVDAPLRCETKTFRTYLEWRRKHYRITKVSTVKSYWWRILCKFIDVAGHSMNDGTGIDIQNVSYTDPTLNYYHLIA